MGIKTVTQPLYSPVLAPEEMKEAVTKVIDTLTQEGFQKVLERYKCIAAGGDYFEGDQSFMCVLSIKVPIRKKSGNLLYAPRVKIKMAMEIIVLELGCLVVEL